MAFEYGLKWLGRTRGSSRRLEHLIEQYGGEGILTVTLKAKGRQEHTSWTLTSFREISAIGVDPTIEDSCQHILRIFCSQSCDYELRRDGGRLPTQNRAVDHRGKGLE